MWIAQQKANRSWFFLGLSVLACLMNSVVDLEPSKVILCIKKRTTTTTTIVSEDIELRLHGSDPM